MSALFLLFESKDLNEYFLLLSFYFLQALRWTVEGTLLSENPSSEVCGASSLPAGNLRTQKCDVQS